MTLDLGRVDYLRGLAARLDEAGRGGRGQLVAEAAKFLGCSPQQVYRELRAIGRDSGRKPRADRGKRLVDGDTALKAATVIKAATRANGKRTIPLTVAADLLHLNGHGPIDRETGEVLKVSTATLSRAMRAHACHPSQIKASPHLSMRSEHPNACWQIDASSCVLFYLPKGRVEVMDEEKFYKNKPANLERATKERVWRYVITDHYSGTIYLRYIQAAGENSLDLAETFIRAVCRRGADDPMHGIPIVLHMDKGAANISHLFLDFLRLHLKIKVITHLPGNSRSKGQVENGQNLVECQFEGRLAFTRIESLAQLQEQADRWRTHFNAHAIHGRTGVSRNSAWMRITEEQLVIAPPADVLRDLVTTRPVEVLVSDDLTVTYRHKRHGKRLYDLRMLPGLVPRCKVSVVANAFRAPAVDVTIPEYPGMPEGQALTYTIEPVIMDEAGFRADAPVIGETYKALPETRADQQLKRIEEAVALGRQSGTAPFGMDVFADLREAPVYMPKRGRDLGLDASRRERPPLSHVEAAKALRARLGAAWTSESYAMLVQRYPGGVPDAEIEAIAARLTAPKAVQPAPLRLVSGGLG